MGLSLSIDDGRISMQRDTNNIRHTDCFTKIMNHWFSFGSFEKSMSGILGIFYESKPGIF